MRTAIKITLNRAVVFDAVILDYLKDKRNKAGQLKKLAYDQISAIKREPGRQTADDDTPAILAPERQETGLSGADNPATQDHINNKLDKLLNF